jgi:hypothetical protein
MPKKSQPKTKSLVGQAILPAAGFQPAGVALKARRDWTLTRLLRTAALTCLTAFTLAAAEHHGQVQFAGLPVPGATVTATQADKKQVAVTDPKGVYTFPDLPDGTWNFQVEMLCFSPIQREVIVAPGAPDAIWELKLLPFAEIQAAAGPPPPKSAPSEQKPVTLTTSS